MSTSDVARGVTAGLRARGHAIWEYALDARIERSGAWLTYCWRKGGKSVSQPTADDMLYHAGSELVTRALRVQPDVVLVISAMYLHPDVLVLMRRAGLKVAVLFTESPYDDEKQVRLLPWLDLAWTNERTSARPGVKYLPHAWDQDVHWPDGPVDDAVPAHDVVFVGTGFAERIELLTAVDWTGLNFGLYGGWDLLGSRSGLRAHLQGTYVSNEHAVKLYRRATIGLNLYRTSKGFGKGAPRVSHAESLNPRAYELAATGCFTISDARAEVTEIFGDLVPTFASAHEVRPLIDRWMADDVGRARAKARLTAAVSSHTWQARAAQIEADLQGVGIGASRASQAAPAMAVPVGD
jgi:spore maturation protein CgeB